MSLHNEANESARINVRRLHTLTVIATEHAQPNRLSHIVNQAVAALDVRACILQQFTEAEPKTIALHHQSDLNPHQIEQITVSLAADVRRGRRAITINDLTLQTKGDSQVSNSGNIKAYLGVPLFDSHGEVFAAIAVLAGESRQFNEDDEWWLRTVAQMAAAALTCEDLHAKLSGLEQKLGLPASTNHAQQSAPAAKLATSVAAAADITTPVATTEIDDAAAAAAAAVEPRKPSVLLIDDDRVVNNVVRRFLGRQGYLVDSAFDGVEGVNKFHPMKHDVVITDIVMPNMNGWDVAAALHARTPKLPILIVTGYSTGGGAWNESFLRQQGIVAVLNKPFDMDYLATVLRDVISKAKV